MTDAEREVKEWEKEGMVICKNCECFVDVRKALKRVEQRVSGGRVKGKPRGKYNKPKGTN